MVYWQQALETVVHKITEKDTFKQELCVKFTKLQGGDEVSTATTGGTQF